MVFSIKSVVQHHESIREIRHKLVTGYSKKNESDGVVSINEKLPEHIDSTLKMASLSPSMADCIKQCKATIVSTKEVLEGMGVNVPEDQCQKMSQAVVFCQHILNHIDNS